MLCFRSQKTVKLYRDLIHEIYEGLGVPYTTGIVYYTHEDADRPSLKLYTPGTNLDKYLRDNDLLRKKEQNALHLYAQMPCDGWNAIVSIKSLNISKQSKRHLMKLCVNLAKIFMAKEDYPKIEEILEQSRFFFIRYIGYHKGHRLHIDSPLRQTGPVIICNFGVSTIDYVPYQEITEADPRYGSFRFRMDPGDVFIMDGDSRRVYRHGVPPNEYIPDYLRYVFCIRLPAIYPDKKKYCTLSSGIFSSPFQLDGARYGLRKPISCSSISEFMHV
jgi:hypothetical protein